MKGPGEIKQLFEVYLHNFLQDEKWNHELYAPFHYLLALPAKRIRPVLALLAYQSVTGKDPDDAFHLGLGLELFHNFTLIHDDIMDNAPVRRGQPTVHKKWGGSTAILSGDAMFAVTTELITSRFPWVAASLVKEFSQVSVGVCEGQMEDMTLATTETVSIPQYLEMIRKKTAVLIGGSMSLAGLAGGADVEVVNRLREFGETTGLAFQLQDDLLDVYGGNSFGKQSGGDILEGKRTFLLLKAFELASSGQAERMRYLLENETDPSRKVSGVMTVYEELRVREETQAKIESYFVKAKSLANELSDFDGFSHIADFLLSLNQRQI